MNNKRLPKQSSICHCTNMRRASRAITQFYDDLLDPIGLKVSQYSILKHLRRFGPLTVNQLSETIGLERTTLVRNLRPLGNIGLISINGEKTSKARIVHLTEKGLASLEMAAPYWNHAQQYLKEIVTEEEIGIFMRVLQKMESIVPWYYSP